MSALAHGINRNHRCPEMHDRTIHCIHNSDYNANSYTINFLHINTLKNSHYHNHKQHAQEAGTSHHKNKHFTHMYNSMVPFCVMATSVYRQQNC